MQAAVLHGREDVRVEEIPPAPLRAGEVRVAIGAALTCGTDLKVYKRGSHARMIVPPAVFGHEFAGTISEIAPGVAGWEVGDRVVAANSAPCGECFHCRHHQENLCDDLLFLNGAYAESIVVPARIVKKNLLRLQPGTAFPHAALTEPLACVVQGWADLKAEPGQRALIIGSGPIGLMFVTLARHDQCHIALAGRGPRLALGQSLGASDIIEISPDASLHAAVTTANVGPFDLVIEAVGKPETWEAAVRLVRKGGKVNFFGGCPAGATVTLDTGLIHYSNLTLLASFHHTPRAIRRALELIETRVINPDLFVDGAAPLRELPSLFRAMAQGNRAVKTLIQVGA
ncbi:MAG TPA: alcohol dehydrogenase catalytic domain-containing protein [Verrucomicrobiae bacterium]|jgi:L-iditol 2-dehydrogenase|nr:alcohol dehydrogenase catalytic domain-containing protein [Verrucomicrobiae bacterium]